MEQRFTIAWLSSICTVSREGEGATSDVSPRRTARSNNAERRAVEGAQVDGVGCPGVEQVREQLSSSDRVEDGVAERVDRAYGSTAG